MNIQGKRDRVLAQGSRGSPAASDTSYPYYFDMLTIFELLEGLPVIILGDFEV